MNARSRRRFARRSSATSCTRTQSCSRRHTATFESTIDDKLCGSAASIAGRLCGRGSNLKLAATYASAEAFRAHWPKCVDALSRLCEGPLAPPDDRYSMARAMIEDTRDRPEVAGIEQALGKLWAFDERFFGDVIGGRRARFSMGRLLFRVSDRRSAYRRRPSRRVLPAARYFRHRDIRGDLRAEGLLDLSGRRFRSNLGAPGIGSPATRERVLRLARTVERFSRQRSCRAYRPSRHTASGARVPSASGCHAGFQPSGKQPRTHLEPPRMNTCGIWRNSMNSMDTLMSARNFTTLRKGAAG